MPLFTVEYSWLLPSVVRETIEAADPAAALAKAERMLSTANEEGDSDDYINFDASEIVYDACTSTQITGLWAGETSYSGPDLRPADFASRVDREIAAETAPEPGARLRSALQWLLDDMTAAGETHAGDGKLFDSVEHAAAALVEAGGTFDSYTPADAEAYRARCAAEDIAAATETR